jgi:hypothetical protein
MGLVFGVSYPGVAFLSVIMPGKEPGLQGGAFFRCLDVAVLERPHAAVHFCAEVAPHCHVFSLATGFLEHMETQLCDDGRLVRDIVGDWCVEHEIVLERRMPNTCIQLWSPVMIAMARGSWNTFFIPHASRVEQRTDFYRVLTQLRRQAADDPHIPALWADDPSPLVPSRLRDLAHHFRRLAACVFYGRDVGDRGEEKTALECDILWLEKHALLLDSISSRTMTGFGRFGSQIRYQIMHLLQTFVMAGALRDFSSLRQTLINSLRVVLPEPTCAFFIESMKTAHVPSAAVLSRFAFTLDCSYMVFTKGLLEQYLSQLELPSVHLLVDSSPQGGIIWLMSHYTLVPPDEVVSWHIQYCALIRAALLQVGVRERARFGLLIVWLTFCFLEIVMIFIAG